MFTDWYAPDKEGVATGPGKCARTGQVTEVFGYRSREGATCSETGARGSSCTDIRATREADGTAGSDKTAGGSACAL